VSSLAFTGDGAPEFLVGLESGSLLKCWLTDSPASMLLYRMLTTLGVEEIIVPNIAMAYGFHNGIFIFETLTVYRSNL
jgi:hypothetical protein